MGAVIERVLQKAEAKRVESVLTSFDQAVSFVSDNYDALLDRYAERWVGVAPDGVVAASKSRAALLRRLRQQGLDPARLYIAYLTRERQTLIL